MRVRLTLEPDDAICLESPFHRDFVDSLKVSIPWDGRKWDAQRKRWIIGALYAADLVTFLQKYGCEIQDDREPGTAVTAVPPMPAELRQAFDALFLAYTAPLCVAEASYKTLARVWHPDRGGKPEDFHSINDAIDTIRHYLMPKEEDDALPF